MAPGQVDVLSNEFYEVRGTNWQRGHVGSQKIDGRLGKVNQMPNLAVIAASNRNDRDGSVQYLECVSKQFMDREPGELSSEDSSGIEAGANGSEDKNEVFSGKKRKLSSLEWDMDDKKISFLKQKTSSKEHMEIVFQSHPAIKSSKSNTAKKILKSEDSLFSFDQKISINSFSGVQLDNRNLTGQLEGDFVPASTLALSRWAAANYSSEDDENTTSDAHLLSNKHKNILLASSRDWRPNRNEVTITDDSLGFAYCTEESCREACLEPLDDRIDDLIADGNDELLEDCKGRALNSLEPPCKTVDMLQCCRNIDEFEKLNKINEGTYGVVYRARDMRNGEIVALKKVKMEKEREGFPLTSLREINILLSLRHPSIVEVQEVVVGRDLDDVFTVMEYMEHDLKGLIETMKKPFHLSEVKCLMLQLFAGVKHLHDNWVLHRDLKTSNLLFNNRGELKICDFGLSRQYGSPLKPYTKLVVTLWYRAPELLLGANEYSTAIDMWSLGCIMAELLTKEPLFPGKSELDQLDKVFRVLGTPNEKIWPGFTKLPGARANFPKKPLKLREKFPRMSAASFLGRPMLSDTGFNLLSRLLTYDPEKRITAQEALNHSWFSESPLPTTKDFMPTFPAVHGKDRHQRRIMKSPDRLEQLMQNKSQ